MKKIDKETETLGHLVAFGIGEMGEKRTRYIGCTFRADEGEYDGAIVKGRIWLTPNTLTQAHDSLLAMGWDGYTHFRKLTVAGLSQKVLLVVKMEEYDIPDRVTKEIRKVRAAQVAFIKPLVVIVGRLSSDGVDELFSSFMRGLGRSTADAPPPRDPSAPVPPREQAQANAEGLPPSAPMPEDSFFAGEPGADEIPF